MARFEPRGYRGPAWDAYTDDTKKKKKEEEAQPALGESSKESAETSADTDTKKTAGQNVRQADQPRQLTTWNAQKDIRAKHKKKQGGQGGGGGGGTTVNLNYYGGGGGA